MSDSTTRATAAGRRSHYELFVITNDRISEAQAADFQSRGPARRADRSAARRPTHDDKVRPGEGQPGPARELHPRGVHGGSDLDRHAEANATLAGLFRRAFIKGAR